MPQVDLETLVIACSGGSDHKISPETTENFPPESFCLSKDSEIDWFDRNAFYERNESAKGNSNPNPVQNSSSQRYSTNTKSKPSIIGLPKTQKMSFRKKSNKQGNVRLFPKRNGSMNKPEGQLTEPSSPNVSCIGRVKPTRKNRKRTEPVKCRSKGICKQFLAMFKTKPVVKSDEPEREPVVYKSEPVRTGIEPGPPGLGAMKRFASGRKSSSSAADVAEVGV